VETHQHLATAPHHYGNREERRAPSASRAGRGPCGSTYTRAGRSASRARSGRGAAAR
jgi:hypothetical protein